jgi:hypothetical protein
MHLSRNLGVLGFPIFGFWQKNIFSRCRSLQPSIISSLENAEEGGSFDQHAGHIIEKEAEKYIYVFPANTRGINYSIIGVLGFWGFKTMQKLNEKMRRFELLKL